MLESWCGVTTQMSNRFGALDDTRAPASMIFRKPVYCLGCRGWVCLVNTSRGIRMPRCQTSRNWVSCTIEVLPERRPDP